jgi:hypothetical protein
MADVFDKIMVRGARVPRGLLKSLPAGCSELHGNIDMFFTDMLALENARIRRDLPGARAAMGDAARWVWSTTTSLGSVMQRAGGESAVPPQLRAAARTAERVHRLLSHAIHQDRLPSSKLIHQLMKSHFDAAVIGVCYCAARAGSLHGGGDLRMEVVEVAVAARDFLRAPRTGREATRTRARLVAAVAALEVR